MDAATEAQPPAEGASQAPSTWPLAQSREKTGAASLVVLAVLIVAPLALIGAVAPPLGDHEDPSFLGGLLAGLLGCGFTFLVYWFYGRAVPAVAIRLGTDGLELPRGPHSNRLDQVPYSGIQTLSSFKGKGFQESWLLIGTARKTYRIPNKRFDSAERIEQFRVELRKRIAAGPDGARQLEAMDLREFDNQAALKRWSIVTAALGVMLVPPFIIEVAAGALNEPLRLIPLGACVPALVFEGEWHRLLTCTFLHANLQHLGFNLGALLALGAILEKVLGRWRLLLAFWVSAATGALASSLFGQAFMMVGASAAVFGLLGGLAVLHLKYWAGFPVAFRQNPFWWAFILGLNFALPILIPQIDWIAHLGGMAGGAFVIWLSVRAQREFHISPPAGPALKVAALGSTALGLAAIGLIAVPALEGRPVDITGLARLLDSADSVSAPAANSFAWDLATDREADGDRLELAERLADKAVSASPEEPAYLDTLAYIAYRRGERGRAIDLQLEAIRAGEAEGEDLRHHANRLSVLLEENLAGKGEPIVRGERAEVQPHLRLKRFGLPDKELDLNIVTPCNGALVAWISVIQRDLLNGIIRVRIDGSQRGETTLDFSKSLGATRVGPGAGSSLDRLRVGLLSCTPGERPAEPTALYWKRDGKAIGLPGPLQAAQMPKAATHQ